VPIDLSALLADPPKLHRRRDGELISDWHVHDFAAHAINSRVKAGLPTLETGAGLSTIIFAAHGCEHTCIVPDNDLIERIKDYCAAKDIDVSSVRFIAAKSCDAIHQLKESSFELVLIDGNHGFPSVFVDFFYAAKALKIGGVLLQDDMHIYTCRLVAEFMPNDAGWRLETFTDRVVVAQKLSDTIDSDWTSQPLTVRRSYPGHRHPIVFGRAVMRSFFKNGPRATLQKIRTRLGI
jgi:hypothetical protein